jgi:hypothetical protein
MKWVRIFDLPAIGSTYCGGEVRAFKGGRIVRVVREGDRMVFYEAVFREVNP